MSLVECHLCGALSQPSVSHVCPGAQKPTKPKLVESVACAVCGKPATCVGRYEDATEDSPASADVAQASDMARALRGEPSPNARARDAAVLLLKGALGHANLDEYRAEVEAAIVCLEAIT